MTQKIEFEIIKYDLSFDIVVFKENAFEMVACKKMGYV